MSYKQYTIMELLQKQVDIVDYIDRYCRNPREAFDYYSKLYEIADELNYRYYEVRLILEGIIANEEHGEVST